MNLPMFPATDSPGSNFLDLLERLGHDPLETAMSNTPVDPETFPHGTTIVAIRYADGVVMAADRRATAGVAIAGRDMEKVQPADRLSGIAISGSAGFGMEMIRLFQLTLEHYEKVEGATLSLEGKANQLQQMVRDNLGAAMQGLIVIPIFAGYDEKREIGRIFNYDPSGGRYEEQDFFATGSGGRVARTTVKLGYRPGMSRDETVELAVESLYEAADEDAATGGPDPVRNIYPRVVTITAEGYNQLGDEEVAERFETLINRRKEQGQRP
jgi:proteasome beta subunit